VDAVSRKEFWEMLGNLKQQGITILVSTPYMDEASRCDRVALIQNGNILQINTPKGITSAFGKTLLAAKAPKMLTLLEQLKAMPGVEDAYPFGEYHHVVLKPGTDHINFEPGVEWKPANPDIEDCFMALMKNNANG
jgi:ABC-type multidrug transport system ATPase subunit